ncbi:serine/threonine-protein kinase [Lentisalinibacter orientalis]|uniref:serine/threonine-protein kinase n=1 Tax=Lentisalinibacter orientalis TaxID=2992241 RepID=UPI00386EC1D7
MTDDQERWQRINALLESALERDESERDAWLREACAGDAALYEEVMQLLAYDGEQTEDIGSAIREVAGSLEPGLAASMDGRRIGAWRIRRKIADGGMGSVYLAHRVDADFEQTAAIKLLPPHRLDPAATARFVEERRILASLEHPNIARLIDGGMLDDGVPYIAMEYVDGVSIEHYCRDNAPDNEGILRLLLKVCDAVQYAHRKLVIHRDIKPSNILIDRQGVPKLVDFGIAKLLDDDAAGNDLTRADQRIMTPLYASPEQIAGQPITTAADVYGLGLLAYRLLTGRMPYTETSERPADVARAILYTPAERPSAAVTSDRPREAEHRTGGRSERWVERQRRALKGDLDVILLKALRKEPERRYESVSAFADDLRRYLANLPVQARPDSFGYVAGKFLRRHRLPVGIAAALLAAVVGLTTFYTAQLAAERTTAQQTADFLVSLLDARNPYRGQDGTVTLDHIVRRGAERIRDDADLAPRVQGRLLTTIADVYSSIGRTEEAGTLIDEALALLAAGLPADHPDVAMALYVQGKILRITGDYAGARASLERSLAIREREQGSNSMPVAQIASMLSAVANAEGDNETMCRWAERSYDIRHALLDADDASLAPGINSLALCHWQRGELQQAAGFYREILRIQKAQPAPNDAAISSTLHNTGLVFYEMGDYRKAAETYEESIERRIRSVGRADAVLPLTLYSLATTRNQLGEFVAARETFERQILLQVEAVGADHPELAFSLTGYAFLLEEMGELDPAAAVLERAAAIQHAALAPDNPDLAPTLIASGNVALKRGRLVEGRALMERALAIRIAALGEKQPSTWRSRTAVARAAFAAGDYADARERLQSVVDGKNALGRPEHPYVAEALGWLGRTELAAGDAPAAVTLLERALELERRQLDDGHLGILELRLALAEALAGAGRTAEAKALREDAALARREILEAWRQAFAERVDVLAALDGQQASGGVPRGSADPS